MEIVEEFIQSKTGDMQTCEDGYVVTDNFVAIIDGATNKSSIHYRGESPGRIATKLCLEVVKSLSPNTTAHEAFTAMDRAIHEFYNEEGVLEFVQNNPASRCTASSILYSVKRRELWFLGDCMAMVDGKVLQFHKDLDQVLSNLRSLLIHVEISRGMKESDLLANDTARKRIIEFLQLQAELQNATYECEYTYHVLDGIASNTPNHVKVIPLDVSTKEIVLSSDGYPTLFPTLDETERVLAETIAADPLCYKNYKSTKGVVEGNISFDDRTYLRIRL